MGYLPLMDHATAAGTGRRRLFCRQYVCYKFFSMTSCATPTSLTAPRRAAALLAWYWRFS